MSQRFPEKRGPKDYVKLVLSGACMGAADIVPGVSGGTIAFLLGIYEELITAIHNVLSAEFFRPLMKFRVKKALLHVRAPFLLSVGSGIIVSVLSLSHVLESALASHPHLLWSMFFGLVLASVIVVAMRVSRWNAVMTALFVAGALAAYAIVGLTPTETPETWWFILLSGAIVICAMILPGVSGSFLLVLLGKYEFILRAVNQRDLVSIGIFCAGAGVGILLFAQVLSRLFKAYHDLTVALLAGLMLGSLRKIWPWNPEYAAVAEGNAAAMIVCMIAGFGAVILLELAFRSSKR